MTKYKMDGSCLCGNINYTAEAEPVRMVTCQCKTCQKGTGSAFSTNVIISNETFKILTGKCSFFETTADSGNKILRYFCPNCGSQIYGESNARPNFMVIRSGTLNDTSWLRPQLRIWCESQQDWLKDIDFGIPSTPQGPPSK